MFHISRTAWLWKPSIRPFPNSMPHTKSLPTNLIFRLTPLGALLCTLFIGASVSSQDGAKPFDASYITIIDWVVRVLMWCMMCWRNKMSSSGWQSLHQSPLNAAHRHAGWQQAATGSRCQRWSYFRSGRFNVGALVVWRRAASGASVGRAAVHWWAFKLHNLVM